MAKAGGGDEEIIADINMTPFVDIVLVLLIIFMVTAKLMFSASIPLELPKASSGEDTKASQFAISIKPKKGKEPEKLYLNGKPTTMAGLQTQIAAALKGKKKVQAIIAADRDVTHGKVILVLDLLRRLGVEDYAFNIDPQPTP
jgi:biopolymer transport protein ExbD